MSSYATPLAVVVVVAAIVIIATGGESIAVRLVLWDPGHRNANA